MCFFKAHGLPRSLSNAHPFSTFRSTPLLGRENRQEQASRNSAFSRPSTISPSTPGPGSVSPTLIFLPGIPVSFLCVVLRSFFCMQKLFLDFCLPIIPLGITLGCVPFLSFLQKSFPSLSLLNPSQPPWILWVLPRFLPPQNLLWMLKLKSILRASRHWKGSSLAWSHVTEEHGGPVPLWPSWYLSSSGFEFMSNHMQLFSSAYREPWADTTTIFFWTEYQV